MIATRPPLVVNCWPAPWRPGFTHSALNVKMQCEIAAARCGHRLHLFFIYHPSFLGSVCSPRVPRLRFGLCPPMYCTWWSTDVGGVGAGDHQEPGGALFFPSASKSRPVCPQWRHPALPQHGSSSRRPSSSTTVRGNGAYCSFEAMVTNHLHSVSPVRLTSTITCARPVLVMWSRPLT